MIPKLLLRLIQKKVSSPGLSGKWGQSILPFIIESRVGGEGITKSHSMSFRLFDLLIAIRGGGLHTAVSI